MNFLPVLADVSILIVNDWNFLSVREGTRSALELSAVYIVYQIEIFTGENPSIGVSNWHNGMMLYILKKH
jgi:hypothetical protein